MAETNAKQQPSTATVAAPATPVVHTPGPVTQAEIARLESLGLAHWEARLLVKARQVRSEQLRVGENRASMVLVKFEGPAMTLWRGSPFTGQRVEMTMSLVRGRYLEIWALASDGMVSE